MKVKLYQLELNFKESKGKKPMIKILKDWLNKFWKVVDL